MWQDILQWSTIGGLYFMAILLFALGFLGAVLPYPGNFVTLVGCIFLAAAIGEPYPEWWFWLIEVLLAVFGTLVDNLTTAIGARKFGGSKSAFWFSMLGLFIGVFFFPLGLLVGPFLGAFIAEIWLARRNMKQSARTGLGATMGLLAGVVCKLIVSGIMITLCLV